MAVGKNTIFVASAKNTCPEQEEAKIATGQTILPGYVAILSSGEFIAHDTAGAGGDWFIVNQNTPAQEDVSVTWTVGDTAQAFIPGPKDFFNVVVATGQTLVKGTALASAGDGTLTTATTTGATPDVVLFYADEDVTTTAAQLVRCRVALSSPAPTA